jgi:hypothetical protein
MGRICSPVTNMFIWNGFMRGERFLKFLLPQWNVMQPKIFLYSNMLSYWYVSIYPVPISQLIHGFSIDADCSSTVVALPACADHAWNLFYSGAFSFCCTADQDGTFSTSGRQCLDKTLPIPTSEILSTVTTHIWWQSPMY